MNKQQAEILNRIEAWLKVSGTARGLPDLNRSAADNELLVLMDDAADVLENLLSTTMNNAQSRVCVYVFGLPDYPFVKIGHTQRPSVRMEQIRWGAKPIQAPLNIHEGTFLALFSVPKEKALFIERDCQQTLSTFQAKVPKRNGKLLRSIEWYEVHPDVAVQTLFLSIRNCEQ